MPGARCRLVWWWCVRARANHTCAEYANVGVCVPFAPWHSSKVACKDCARLTFYTPSTHMRHLRGWPLRHPEQQHRHARKGQAYRAGKQAHDGAHEHVPARTLPDTGRRRHDHQCRYGYAVGLAVHAASEAYAPSTCTRPVHVDVMFTLGHGGTVARQQSPRH